MATVAEKLPKVNFGKAGEFITKNFTPIIYVVGAIVAILLIKKILSGFLGKDEGTNPETSTNDATLIARNLFDAMNRLGTDEKTLFDSITPLTKSELLDVIAAFGLKSYFGSGYGAVLGQDKSLQGWLKAELSNKEDKKMKALFDAKNVPY